MKKISMLLAMFLLSMTAIIGCSGNTAGTNSNGNSEQNGSGSNDPIVINIGTTTTEDSSFPQAMKLFKEEVEGKTNGEIKVNLHYNSALGGEREMVEAASIGTLEGAMVSSAVITNFVPEMAVLDIPFIFEDLEHARSAMQGEAGKLLGEKMENANLKLLSWGETGFRHITNNERPIEKPEDLEGLKIRTMENNVHLEAFQELGADPTPMAWGEVFTSLQQGVIDGQENPIFILYVNNLEEVQKYTSRTGHVYSAGALLLSKQLFDSLTEEQQEIVITAAQNGAQANYDYNDEKEAEYQAEMESKGMVFNEVDKAPFIEALKPITDKYKDASPEVYEAIMNAK
ncbi:TRAP transporter substrate-binding protein DctP [Robertmurraya massiliosenegalensis]|uniref:TRAP transporter substrate-binding protein DctP n=1 Tax=Robertmurraya TaxID=2837507 RepID=UPI0039A4CACC